MVGFLSLLPTHDKKIVLFHLFKSVERKDQHQLMKGSPLKNAATAKGASFHLSAAPSLSHFCLSCFSSLQMPLRPGDTQYSRAESHLKLCIKTSDLLKRAPQRASALLRMRQLRVGLFCWAFKKCLCVDFVRLSRSVFFVRSSWPAAWHFLGDVAFSTVACISKKAS